MAILSDIIDVLASLLDVGVSMCEEGYGLLTFHYTSFSVSFHRFSFIGA